MRDETLAKLEARAQELAAARSPNSGMSKEELHLGGSINLLRFVLGKS